MYDFSLLLREPKAPATAGQAIPRSLLTSLLSLLREHQAWTQILTHSRHGDSDTDTNARTHTHTYCEGHDSARKGHVSGN